MTALTHVHGQLAPRSTADWLLLPLFLLFLPLIVLNKIVRAV